MGVKTFEIERIKRYFGAQGVKDLDRFLDNLPIQAGMVPLAGAATMWAIAALSLLFAYTKTQEMFDIQQELMKAESLTPSVPKMIYTSVRKDRVEPYVARMQGIYNELQISMERSGVVNVTAPSTRFFTSWRAAIDGFAYMERNKRLSMKTVCAGRECEGSPLQASFQIQEIDIQMPQTNNG